MGFRIFGKDSGRCLTRDIIVFVVCLIIYGAFIYFLATPTGFGFFEFIIDGLPFKHLLAGTLSDLDRMLGAIFEDVVMNDTVNSIVAEFGLITLDGVFIDLSKLMVSSFIQSVIFLAFSYLFLYAGNFNIASVLIVGIEYEGKKDFLYHLNSSLLMGISVLVGGITGNALMECIQNIFQSMNLKERILISFVIFLVVLLLFSLYFSIKSKKAAGGFFSLSKSIAKTMAFNVLPEMLSFFVTNLLALFIYHSFNQFGIHWRSLLALLIFLVWMFIVEKIKYAASLLVNKDLILPHTKWGCLLGIKNIPICGEKCPISGIFWLFSNISFIIIIYAVAVIAKSDSSLFVEFIIGRMPFVNEWLMGEDLFSNVFSDIMLYITPFLQLLALCTIMSFIQYVSSSFTVTLYTQVFVRLGIILGVMLVLAVCANVFIVNVATSWVEKIGYSYFAVFMGVLLYILFSCLQPQIALQGILTAGGTLLFMEIFPGYNIAYGVSGEIKNEAFLGFCACAIGINLFLSLLQNIIAFVEKMHRK